MKGSAKVASLLGAAVLIGGAGAWLWQQFYSNKGQVETMHRACIAEFAEAAAKMKSGVANGTTDSGSVKGLSERLGKTLGDASAGMGDAVCSALRDACRDDFDGRICTAARERYL